MLPAGAPNAAAHWPPMNASAPSVATSAAGASSAGASSSTSVVSTRDRAASRLTGSDYPIGCKRVLFSNDWYPALVQPHVEVVTDPIERITPTGVRTVDPLLVRAARTLGLSNLQLFAKVVLPSAVPTIFTGIRMAGTASILVLIAAEMVGAKAGLGYLIVNAQSSFQIPQMYAGILTVSVFGLVVNTALVRLERRLSRWRVTPQGS